MQRRNLDFEIALTREQWQQLGESANLRPDAGVLRWSPAEFDVIRLSIHEDDRPAGFAALTPPPMADVAGDLVVARFVYNDGRPYARLQPPAEFGPPRISPEEERALDQSLERWVRDRWRQLLRDSGIAYDRGALPATEPRPPV